jgi:hypothetical protein
MSITFPLSSHQLGMPVCQDGDQPVALSFVYPPSSSMFACLPGRCCGSPMSTTARMRPNISLDAGISSSVFTVAAAPALGLGGGVREDGLTHPGSTR